MTSISNLADLRKRADEARVRNWQLFLADSPNLIALSELIPDEKRVGFHPTKEALLNLIIAAGVSAYHDEPKDLFANRLTTYGFKPVNIKITASLTELEYALLIGWCGSELARLSHFYGEG